MKNSILKSISLAGFLVAVVANPAPALTLNGDVSAGGTVGDGGRDQYDNFGVASINAAASIYSGAVSGAAPTFTTAVQTISGVNVTGQVQGFQSLGVYNTFTDYRIVRWWYKLENPGTAKKVVNFVFGGNFGSDSSTVITASAGNPFRWLVTDDNSPLTGDPAIGTVLSSTDAAIHPVSVC